MTYRTRTLAALLALAACSTVCRATVKVDVDHQDPARATPRFAFPTVPAPASVKGANNLSRNATFAVIDGERDETGADADVLHDGKLPTDADQPDGNFFFAANTRGGRVRIDLAGVADVQRVSTYSWHTDARAPQVYALYAADGTAAGFNPAPRNHVDPATCGWTLVANVDTRPKSGGEVGGQYGVNVSDPEARSLGRYRYLLLDVSPTEQDDGFGNTFLSEVDVVGNGGAELMHRQADAATTRSAAVKTFQFAGGKYTCTIDTTDTPDLTQWANTELAAMVAEQYPRIVAALPSPNYVAPAKFSITFHDKKKGVADTLFTRINCAASWYRHTLKTEAKGSIYHEMVHVVANYWQASRVNHHPAPSPGWLGEGICDYLRWYKYEPKSGGANIARGNADKVNYDDSYRTTANFLNYVSNRYDRNLVVQLNAAMRTGTYSDQIWSKCTGKSADDLNAEWKAGLAKQ